MVASITIQVNVKAAYASLDPDVYAKRMRAGMGEATTYLKGLVQVETPVDEGILRGGIFTDIRGEGIGIHGIVAPGGGSRDYAAVVENGRRPGARMPPPQALRNWLRHHGLPESMAFVVARSIARKGTKGAHMFAKAQITGAVTATGIIARHLRG
jgi:hypothetical protein